MTNTSKGNVFFGVVGKQYTSTDIPESPHHLSHLYEGDIKLSEEQRLNNILFGNPDGAPSRAATNVDKIKWPSAVIPYEFDCSVGEYFQLNSFRFLINALLF